MSPFILGYVFRKRSFLHALKPRSSSPALLASMLCVAAQTSEVKFLTAHPATRGRICQRLFDLTVSLLKPLSYDPLATTFAGTSLSGVGRGSGAAGVSGAIGTEGSNRDDGTSQPYGALDEVATYIHLATVVSASEHKGSSLRWWNAAWSLARELKLGRELPPHEMPSPDVDMSGSEVPPVTEEEREERRRTWWLLYIVDRHLSLCYNKPLFFLDAECEELLLPMDDTLWQAGEEYTDPSAAGMGINSPDIFSNMPRRGPGYECTGHSVFGFFLPLMMILGEIVDLNHARNHPRLGRRSGFVKEWEEHTNEISAQLHAYEQSLQNFGRRHSSVQHSRPEFPGLDTYNQQRDAAVFSPSNPPHGDYPSRETSIQTQIVIAYGTHILHVLHILLTGQCHDPITLLSSPPHFLSSPQFVSATGHAIAAAEALEGVLEHDPGLEFMPFFFGVYLLQGSFMLLFCAERFTPLGGEGGGEAEGGVGEWKEQVVKACEIVVRAHEACVVTLNTEYQVS
jgi:hypothetical protein